MGAWGEGILDNDSALDTKGTFEDALENGKSVEQAALDILEKLKKATRYYGIAAEVLALAACTMAHGQLPAALAKCAKTKLKQQLSGNALAEWNDPEARKEELKKFKSILDVYPVDTQGPKVETERHHLLDKIAELMGR